MKHGTVTDLHKGLYDPLKATGGQTVIIHCVSIVSSLRRISGSSLTSGWQSQSKESEKFEANDSWLGFISIQKSASSCNSSSYCMHWKLKLETHWIINDSVKCSPRAAPDYKNLLTSRPEQKKLR